MPDALTPPNDTPTFSLDASRVTMLSALDHFLRSPAFSDEMKRQETRGTIDAVRQIARLAGVRLDG